MEKFEVVECRGTEEKVQEVFETFWEAVDWLKREFKVRCLLMERNYREYEAVDEESTTEDGDFWKYIVRTVA
jgi:hypothetical protein